MEVRIASNNGENLDKYEYKDIKGIQVNLEAFNALSMHMHSILNDKNATIYEVTYNTKDWTLYLDKDTGRRTKLRKTKISLYVTDLGSVLVVHRGWNIETPKQLYVKQGDKVYYYQRRKQADWNIWLPELFKLIDDDMYKLINYIQDDLECATSLRVKELSKIDEWLNSGGALVETVKARKG